ncbi:lipid kinase, YegS/Rv2252/BmrU family [Candidatus Kryptonium thompsonii]|nr:lipid kinase, YegS/Rv2252/BmrU family [Candidatus Kryptonium thompsoni]
MSYKFVLSKWFALGNELKTHIVLNPYAGRWKGAKLYHKLIQYVRHLKYLERFQVTTAPGEAIQIARDTPAELVVAAGGDGTVNEIVNGILQSNSEKLLGVIPIGSGNDFAKMLNLKPFKIKVAIESIKRRRITTSDVGIIRFIDEFGNSGERFFINGVGVGFDAVVANESRKIKHLRGILLYLLALLKSLKDYETPEMEVYIDGKKIKEKIFLVAVGNGKSAGGGFLLPPDAKINDALLDVCLVNDLSILRVLQVIPTVLKGKHIQ